MTFKVPSNPSHFMILYLIKAFPGITGAITSWWMTKGTSGSCPFDDSDTGVILSAHLPVPAAAWHHPRVCKGPPQCWDQETEIVSSCAHIHAETFCFLVPALWSLMSPCCRSTLNPHLELCCPKCCCNSFRGIRKQQCLCKECLCAVKQFP